MSEDPTNRLPGDALSIILARFDSLEARLTTLEDTVERRLQDTRPIWESALEQLKTLSAQMQEVKERLQELSDRQQELSDRQQEMNERLTRVEFEIRDTRRTFRIICTDLSRAHADLEERVEKIEERPAS